MPSPFDDIKLDDAIKFVRDLQAADVDVSALYYRGDHWQAEAGWVGPKPALTDAMATETWKEIERAFISKNAVKETVNRHRDAVIGHEPDWSFTVRRPLKEGEEPTAAEQALIEEAEAALTEWWDRRSASGGQVVLGTIQRAAATLLWAGRAALRLFVPPVFLAEGQAAAADVQTWLGRIFLKHPDIDVSAVVVDPDTQQPLGIFLFKEAKEDPKDVNRKADSEFAELHFVDDGGNTRLVILSEKDAREESDPFDLSGNLLVYEMAREALITPQVNSNQALLNMALTMAGRNVVLAGFLERIILNAQLPGSWEKQGDGSKKFVPNPFYVGAGTTNALVGVPIYGDPAKSNVITGYANPSVVYRDPVSVQTFKDTEAMAYGNILDETSQRHVMISRDATASGESRIQATADFIVSLLTTATQVNAAGRWLLETVLALAAQLAGQPGRYAELRANFQCKIDPGPLPAELQRIIMERVKARLLSRNTAIAMLGTDDPDGEAGKIEAEEAKAPAVTPPANPALPVPQMPPAESETIQ